MSLQLNNIKFPNLAGAFLAASSGAVIGATAMNLVNRPSYVPGQYCLEPDMANPNPLYEVDPKDGKVNITIPALPRLASGQEIRREKCNEGSVSNRPLSDEELTNIIIRDVNSSSERERWLNNLNSSPRAEHLRRLINEKQKEKLSNSII